MIRKSLREHYLETKGVPEQLRALEEYQRLDPAKIAVEQESRLRSLLLHAYYHVPYYHELLPQHGVVDGEGRVDLGRFAALPLLDKSTIQKNQQRLRSDDLPARKWGYATSGGSTGTPVRVLKEFDTMGTRALPQLFDSWASHYVCEPEIRMWGSLKDVKGKSRLDELGRRFTHWTRNELWLNSYRVKPDRLIDFVKKINRYRPTYIFAYTDFIYYLSRYIEREGLVVHSPRSIAVTATPLRPEMRKTIEQAFAAPVFDRYGSNETPDIASECERHQGLHISPFTHYVEIVKPDGSPAAPGETGELVVTLLYNKAMPLIRYRLEDMSSWAARSCPCGRTWPLLERIIGRTIDVFVSRGGELISSGLFITILEHINYERGGFIDKYQIVQEDYDYIKITIVPVEQNGRTRETYRPAFEEITKIYRRALGGDCRVEFVFTDDIQPLPSGKFCFALSKVAKDPHNLESLFSMYGGDQ